MKERFEAFTVLVAGINRCIYKIKTEEMVEFNLKSSHVSCLYYLYKAKFLTAKELCDMCGEDKANISRSIKYLEMAGFIVGEDANQKRYQSALSLTEKGEEVGKKIAEKVDRILNEASSGLDEESRVVMYKSLSLIYNNLNKICDGYDSKGEYDKK